MNPIPDQNEINQLVKGLSLRQRLLELIMLDIRYFDKDNSGTRIPVTKLPNQIKQLFREFPIGGVILFRENLTNLADIPNLTSTLQQHTQFGRLIGIDQEGGTITRITGATDMPGNMALGAINDPKITTQAAGIIAKELKTLGINLDFAPCVDVNSNPKNPIIGVRSFGSDPNLVALHGCAYVDGLNQQQIISCIKHFPGHGNVTTDTHLAETYVNRSAVEIEKCDLYPFQSNIAHGINMIMTAHIIANRLDNSQLFSNINEVLVGTPATLSHTILTKILRNQMGFKGVIASDALDMEAITNNFSPIESTCLALNAGVDLIVMPVRIWDDNGIKRFIDYFNQICAICNQDPQLASRVELACTRVLHLKSKYNLLDPIALNPKQSTILTHKIVGCSNHREFEQQLAAQAITLYRNTKKTLPWQTTNTDKILIISAHHTIAEEAKTTLTKLNYLNTIIALTNESSLEVLIKYIQNADKVLVLTYNLTKVDPNLDQIINRLNHFHTPYVMLSCRNPYDILYVKDVNTNVLVFGVSGLDQTNYHVRQFNLNINQAIIKIFNATADTDFNHHCPVDLNPIKKDMAELNNRN